MTVKLWKKEDSDNLLDKFYHKTNFMVIGPVTELRHVGTGMHNRSVLISGVGLGTLCPKMATMLCSKIYVIRLPVVLLN